ncbi:hypothetical protein A1OQ_20210 [Enterovibrio norvegicus FF-162]|uniref:Uncharacterized protein n=1 Tax=Enterovibrio norvegicus FF-454 TaxID=1185651 RepID=A0A1E5C0C6_9GAMM|nr:hypothetical protein [Enterovibrio norvegicus]OEE58965.1 hypothetical protein A1OK_02875 [Enterovibrio norvegicus FF-454]OEE82297.1 hypothetical protein A1OQ_20210 [Enterovibrio norvegicus FF-162]
MYRLDFENQCSIIADPQEEQIQGTLVSAFHGANSSVVMIDRRARSDGPSVTLDRVDAENLIALPNTYLVKVSSRTRTTLPTPRFHEQPLSNVLPTWEGFVQQSLSCFHAEMSVFFRHVVARLKTKKVGENTLIDIENVALSVTDYHRFLFHVELASQTLPETLTPLSERVLLASNTLSNLQGGISILAGSGVEHHLQYALLLNDLEQWR